MTEVPTFTAQEAAESLARGAGVTSGGPLIHHKIIEVMRAVGPVAKAGLYQQGNTRYNYRRADDVFDALHGALAEAGIYPKPIVRGVDRNWGTTKAGDPRQEVTLRITYRFTAEDGSYEDVDLEIDNWNSSDKGIPVSMTVALRVALLQLFVIPTGDPDPDAVREEMGTGPTLSTPLAQYLLRAIKNGPLDRLEEAWNLLVEHVPGDSRLPGTEAPIVWWEVFAERYRNEVDARKGKDDLAELWNTLRGFGLGFNVGDGIKVADLISRRATALAAENKAALQECRDTIQGADDALSLDHAREVVRQHLTNHRISSADSLMFAEMLAGRADQIRETEAAQARAAMDPDEGYDGEPQLDYPRDED